jgi:hypothetical protein
MNEITWKYVKPVIDEDNVLNFLQQHGVNLPQQILDCIIENNGGRPSINIFNTNKSKERVFKSLLSYNSDDTENIYSVYPHLFRGSGLYPIGTDTAGNFICVDLSNDYKLILWEHESKRKELIDQTEFHMFDEE